MEEEVKKSSVFENISKYLIASFVPVILIIFVAFAFAILQNIEMAKTTETYIFALIMLIIFFIPFIAGFISVKFYHLNRKQLYYVSLILSFFATILNNFSLVVAKFIMIFITFTIATYIGGIVAKLTEKEKINFIIAIVIFIAYFLCSLWLCLFFLNQNVVPVLR